jgi:hypothetical protein
MAKEIKIKSQNKSKIFRIVIIIFIILIILTLSFFTFYFYKKSNNINNLSNKELSTSEINKVIKKVQAIVVVPEEETPSVAMVTDPTLLSAQSFFASAKKGDIVLLYSSLGKVILFDMQIGKIIDIAPIDMSRISQ